MIIKSHMLGGTCNVVGFIKHIPEGLYLCRLETNNSDKTVN